MTSTSTNPGTNPNLAAALAYAQRGWHVFPLRPGSKKPAVPTHPADRCGRTDPRCAAGHTGWEQRATTDPDRITRAWTSTPGYGVGIACGPSRLVVVDLDTPKPNTILPPTWAMEPGVVDGSDVLAVLAERQGQPWPSTRTVTTPSGGLHLYYNAPHDVQLHNTTARLGPMVDTRAHGGYVAAPPTRTPDGPYTSLGDDDPEPLSSWLHAALTTTYARPPTSPPPQPPTRPGRYVEAAVRHELGRVTHAAPGTRNQALFVSALALGQLVGAGALDHARTVQVLTDAAAGHVSAGAFTGSEAASTIVSGLRRGIADPRHLPAATQRGAA